MSEPRKPSSPDTIFEAVAILRRGGLVAFPTETVYGLGADASNPAAVARLYSVKGRPSSHPVIVHIGAIDQISSWAREVPAAAEKLAARFWPGPLTLLLRRAAGVPDSLTGGQDSIGLRVPGHPLALELLRRFGGGIAAPSANKFGRISPTTAEHVRRDLGNEVDLVLDGGACEVGIESTILDLSRDRPMVLRPGRVGAEEIAAAIGTAAGERDADAPRAPGTLEAHYAPLHPLEVVKPRDWDTALRRLAAKRRGVLAFRPRPARESSLKWIAAPADAAQYARALYASLRALDESDCEVILVEAPPRTGAWSGVNDRLARAANRG